MKLSAQMKRGKKVEMDHAHLFPKNLRDSITTRIAKDHLREDPKYYTKLKKAKL
jgi:hypothetical protein